MEILNDLVVEYWVIGLVILGFIIWADKNGKSKQTDTAIADKSHLNQETIIIDMDDTIETNTTKNEKSLGKNIYNNLLNVPVWALYFLILSTVVLTILILTKIWFPEVFVEDFFARILMSYAALIVSTYVIAKMSEAIKDVKK